MCWETRNPSEQVSAVHTLLLSSPGWEEFVITKPVHSNRACLSAPQYRKSCQSSPSHVPLIWPRQQCMKGYDGRPVSHRHYKISRNASDKFIISACHPHPIFYFLLSALSRCFLHCFFYLTLINTFLRKNKMWTVDPWAMKEAFVIPLWTLLEIYLEKLLQILGELSPSNTWLAETILVTKRANPHFPTHLFVRLQLLIFIIFLTCYCLEFFTQPCLPWV